MSARCSTAVPRRRTLAASRHRSSMSSAARSASTSSLIVRRTRLSTVGDRAFPVAGPRIWNSLPQHVTSAPSLAIFRSRRKTHLFRRCFPCLHRSPVVPEKWHVITDTLIVFITYLLTLRCCGARVGNLTSMIGFVVVLRRNVCCSHEETTTSGVCSTSSRSCCSSGSLSSTCSSESLLKTFTSVARVRNKKRRPGVKLDTLDDLTKSVKVRQLTTI